MVVRQLAVGRRSFIRLAMARVPCVLAAVVVAGMGAVQALAGPWSSLPQAVSELSRDAADPESRAVRRAAAQSLLVEAASGRLEAVRAMASAYADIVAPALDAQTDVEQMRLRVARALVQYGDRAFADQPRQSARAWALALELDPGSDALGRLRSLLVPPADPAPGERWHSPLDKSEVLWLPRQRFRLGCTVGDEMCDLDEERVRTVDVSGFWMETVEVTAGRYQRCVDRQVCASALGATVSSDPTLPVVGVTWSEAVDFCSWIGRRLPTEAEWERAARGTAFNVRFPWGDQWWRQKANALGVVGDDRFADVAPVGAFPALGLGLHDLAGNVWEWCADRYHTSHAGGPEDGRAWTEDGVGRVVRGGSWRRTLASARVSARTWQMPDARHDDLGLRCVADAAQRIDDERVRTVVRRAFSLPKASGQELERADLDRADRLYLERRALTWSILEGRVWEALPRAVWILRRQRSDPLARDLVEGLERRLADAAASADLEELVTAMERFRTEVLASASETDASAGLSVRVASALQKAADRRLADGDRVGAAECLRLSLLYDPEDQEAVASRQQLMPQAGRTRIWSRDGKLMAYVPEGTFRRGRNPADSQATHSEEPVTTVTVAPFWIDRTEVTNAEYRRCVQAGACTPPERTQRYELEEAASEPVLWVSWFQASRYARWAGKRLPSEAEWEYAARSGAVTRFPWGDLWEDGRANLHGVRGRDVWRGPAPVASFAPNSWGLFDMIGNAWEWVADAYHDSYHGAPVHSRPWTQLSGADGEADRVMRGGSFEDFSPRARVSTRDHHEPGSSDRSIGFRCVVDP